MDWFRAIGVLGLAGVSGSAGWLLNANTLPQAEVAQPRPAAAAPGATAPQGADDKPLIMVASDGQVTLRVEQQPLEWVLEQLA